MSTLDALAAASSSEAQTPFGGYQEEAIISLALDLPEFFTTAARFIKPDHFGKLEAKWLMAEILNTFEKYNIVPTRKWLKDHVSRQLNADDNYQEMYRLIDRKSDPREIPLVKDTLLKWSKDKAFGMLYSDDAIEAYHRGDYSVLEGIIQDANRIADSSGNGFWFFDSLDILFQPDAIEHKTTGFAKLDQYLNNGGPSRKEVVCWLAATNVGKSIMLCNNAISSFKGEGSDGQPGQDVLLITFELDTIKTAMRCLATATGIPIAQIPDKQDYITRVTNTMKQTYKKRFHIHEMPPDECSVNHIYALIDTLGRTEGWHPDVVIIDYMDLMISRNPSYNKDDYTRQKHVANEIRGLAKNENVLVFTATQTNRSGAKGDEVVDMTKAAESFGKQFSLDYVVSLNQTQEERKMLPPRICMYIAKNRNGPKLVTVNCEINYDNMVVKEVI